MCQGAPGAPCCRGRFLVTATERKRECERGRPVSNLPVKVPHRRRKGDGPRRTRPLHLLQERVPGAQIRGWRGRSDSRPGQHDGPLRARRGSRLEVRVDRTGQDGFHRTSQDGLDRTGQDGLHGSHQGKRRSASFDGPRKALYGPRTSLYRQGARRCAARSWHSAAAGRRGPLRHGGADRRRAALDGLGRSRGTTAFHSGARARRREAGVEPAWPGRSGLRDRRTPRAEGGSPTASARPR